MKWSLGLLALCMLIPVAAAVRCGDTVNSSLTLTQHLTNCDKFGLILTDGAALDCDGFAVRGRGIEDSYGIAVVGKNISVKNCEAYDFSVGLFAKDTRDLTVDHFVMVEKGFIGILLSGVNGATIENIKLRNLTNGIWMKQSKDVSINNGNISAGRGMFIEDSSLVAADGLSITDTVFALRVTRSDQVYLSGNSFVGSTTGILIEDSSQLKLRTSRVVNCNLRTERSDNLAIERNDFLMGGLNIGRTNHSTITGNSIRNARSFGIELNNADDILVANNTVTGSASANILVGKSKSVAVTGNALSQSKYGIFSTAEGKAFILRNAIMDNNIGIWLDSNATHGIAGNAFRNSKDLDGYQGKGLMLDNLLANGRPNPRLGVIFALNRYLDPWLAYV
ncbi:MAG: NosD domain-containing protein [Nanoarchaeota archaeon]